MKDLYWHIEGYDSLEKIYDRKVKAGCFTRNQMGHLLKALAAQSGLTMEEITGAYARRKTRISNDLLQVHTDPKYGHMMCGDNPHFIARMVRDSA
jgi:hypothetical protein